MKQNNIVSSFLKNNAATLAAAVTGFCVILLFTRHSGIGVSPDSVIYMSVAENIHRHGAIQDFNEWPLVDFPSFYPIFLDTVMFITRLQPLAFAPVLNAMLFALVIFCAGVIMDRFSFRSRWYKWLLLSCVAVSSALLEIYSMLWSETLFVLLVLLFIITLHRYFQLLSIKTLLVAAAVAAFACITRYAGITLIAAGGILLLTARAITWRKKTLHIILFGITAGSLLIINLARNKNVSHTLTGYRETAIRSFADNLYGAGAVFFDWLPFPNNNASLVTIITIAILTALAIVWLRQLLRNKAFSVEHISITFFLVYAVFMIVVASVSRFEPLNSRLLAPLFIPFLWSISSWLPAAVQTMAPSKKKWLVAGGFLCFVVFQYNQLTALNETWDGIKDAGIPGYTEDQWRYSPTVLFIQKNKALLTQGHTIYSNAADAVYFFTGCKAELLPHKEFPADITEFVKDNRCYVIWFDDGYNPDLVGLPFITGVKHMKLVKRFEDGAVYVAE